MPAECEICGKLIGSDSEIPGICRRCTAGLPLRPENKRWYPILTKRFERLSFSEFEDSVRRLLLFSPFFYEGEAAIKLRNMKFHEKIAGISSFVFIFSQILLSDLKNKGVKAPDFVTAVPLSRNGLRRRGFNQAKEIAVLFSKYTNIPYVELLVKTRDTGKLSEQGFEKRLRAVDGVFSVKEECYTYMRGGNILIVDDVATTGSTLFSASKTLMKYSGISVIPAALASNRKNEVRDGYLF